MESSRIADALSRGRTARNSPPGAVTVLIVPGWMGSGPAHWQAIWERRNPEYRRVVQKDWRSVHRGDWIVALERSLRAITGDVVLVGHSLGCLAIASWAVSGFRSVRRIRGAMLVAPPDLERAPGCLPALSSFTPVPGGKLSFSSLLVASENDPYAKIDAAAAMAEQWGSEFVNVGAAGHINADSGYGDWPEGERYLQDFLRELGTTKAGVQQTSRTEERFPCLDDSSCLAPHSRP